MDLMEIHALSIISKYWDTLAAAIISLRNGAFFHSF